MPSELEQKLLRLALDPGAQPGEIQAAAIKLVEYWRKKGMHLNDILGQPNGQAAQPPAYYAPDYGLCTMPFGKHKGAEFKDVPPSYLRWLLSQLKASPNQKFPKLAEEIENFLNQ